MSYSNEERKRLSFAQAEGAARLPSQLELGELSAELRLSIWNYIWACLETATVIFGTQRMFKTATKWKVVIKNDFINRRGQPLDEFPENVARIIQGIKGEILSGSYIDVFEILTSFMRDADTPRSFSYDIQNILVRHQAAYRVWDRDTIVPYGSDAELGSATESLTVTEQSGFIGARSHLKAAGQFLSEGNFAASVRESVHAVESVARQLEPSATTLGPALSKLEKGNKIHPAMKSGFSALYGYTSDAQGIRHPLIESGQAAVDEADAMYMFGTCAAFVSYMIRKAGDSS